MIILFISCIFIFILCYCIVYFTTYNKKKIIISIEGNIGAGKTTLVSILKNSFNNIHVVDEPVEEWINVKDDKNILQYFYDDKCRWGYTFQNFAYITRLKNIIAALNNNNVILTDRTMETDRNVFGLLCYENKYITELEWKIYNHWHDFYKQYVNVPIYTIYLKTSPDICYDRIIKRGRKEEANIEKEYLIQLHEKHEEWINSLESKNVIVFNGDVNFKDDEKIISEYVHMIKNMLKS